MDGKTKERLCALSTPCYVIDEKKIRQNLTVLKNLQDETGAKVLLAQKAFSAFRLYPLIGQYLSGTTASGLYEARLAAEEMPGRENHVFAPAFKDEDMRKLVAICDHIVFNSHAQYRKHIPAITEYNAGNNRKVSVGIRINPEFSTQTEHAVYDPCAPFSRLGMTYENFRAAFGDTLPHEIKGLHFHTLCEQNSDDLIATFRAFENKFAPYFSQIEWLNLGGGHHITREDYDVEALKKLLRSIREKYDLQVYLEPGEAIALNAGYLVTEVQDVVHNGMDILILDASAECHMPDVLEGPYRPPLAGGAEPGEKAHTYRLSSMTCLAGDIVGDYSFDSPLVPGDKLVFEDMAIYSMVKNNTFNGMPLPSVYLLKENGECELIKKFGYADFKGRLS